VKTKEINVAFNLDFTDGFLEDNRVLVEFLKRSGKNVAQVFYPKGISNFGQTCYLNVVLQLAFHIN
jgi:ubiquitin C-terminal hydrolase